MAAPSRIQRSLSESISNTTNSVIQRGNRLGGESREPVDDHNEEDEKNRKTEQAIKKSEAHLQEMRRKVDKVKDTTNKIVESELQESDKLHEGFVSSALNMGGKRGSSGSWEEDSPSGMNRKGLQDEQQKLKEERKKDLDEYKQVKESLRSSLGEFSSLGDKENYNKFDKESKEIHQDLEEEIPWVDSFEAVANQDVKQEDKKEEKELKQQGPFDDMGF